MGLRTLGAATVFGCLVLGGAVHAHQTVQVVEVGDETLYTWADHEWFVLWRESNGLGYPGMFRQAQGLTTIGLQMHDVCLGTYSLDQVKALNNSWAYCLFEYLPWTEGEQACLAAGGEFVPRDEYLGVIPPPYQEQPFAAHGGHGGGAVVCNYAEE